MDTTPTILSARAVSREFTTPKATLRVLEEISLDVMRGEMVAVTGASGVGKSTLLHILGGLDHPTAGEVVVDGESLRSKSVRELARFRNERIGFVFQFHYLLDDFSALENVMMPMLIAGKRPEVARERAELLLADVGLTDRTSHRPRELSGGEQQRVAVARALANNPDVVLADEPSGNLDTRTGRHLHDLLFDLNQHKQMTFVIATHDRELAGRCHRELGIIEGSLKQQRHDSGE
jgi:lipoprotein-releasing system ATP-binding protein